MMKGDLVWVQWPDLDNWLRPVEPRLRPGIVIDYRPDVCGGSGAYTARWAGGQGARLETVITDKRGEALVQLLDGEGVSWFDEAKLLHSTSGTQGA